MTDTDVYFPYQKIRRDNMHCQCGTELNRISANDYICPVCGNRYRAGLNGIVERKCE